MTNVSIFNRRLCKMLLVLVLMTAWAGSARADYVANENYPNLTTATQQSIGTSGRTIEIPLSSFIGNNNVVFSRVFAMDAHTNQPLYDLTSAFSMTTTVQGNAVIRGLFCQTDYGYIEMIRWNATLTAYNILFTLPDSLSWSDVRIVAVKKTVGGSNKNDEVSKANALGIQGDFAYGSFSVTSDPSSWDAAIVYTVKQILFTPYEGVVGTSGDFETNAAGKRRQKTHTWSYDYYVQPGTKVELKAPIVDGNDIEYSAYWRWYDDNSYTANDRLTTDASHGALLSEKFVDEQNKSVGWLYYGTSKKNTYWREMASVVYNVPNDDSWAGADIAADAGRYTDWQVDAAGNFREPTLSMRYKFHLHPAKEIAAKIKNAILNGNAYENHGNITIALSDLKSSAYHTLRLDLRDMTQYWFYPYTKMLWSGTPQEIYFNAGISQAKSFTWAVHIRKGSRYYYKPIVKNNVQLQSGIRLDLRKEDVVGTYYDVENADSTIQMKSVETGREYIIIVYANSYNSTAAVEKFSSPVARFNCYFITQAHPQEVAGTYDHRDINHLESNYTRVGLINFDDFTGMTFDDPKQPYTAGRSDNNSWDKPLPWGESYYGFTYPQLKNKNNTNTWIGFSPIHGDYVLVKSANYGTASRGWEKYKAGNPGYRWWYQGEHKDSIPGTVLKNGPTLHDRTWSYTNGARHGYFLYVDAADEARPIASLKFEANLCSGSTLILSAAVANLTDNGESPQLLLKLYGVKYDDAGNTVATQLIQSFSSGDFASHGINDKARWYQIYAKTFIHPNTNADSYTHYLVTIENNCRSTSGADYAIDDIRFYVSNSQVEVLQQADAADLCEVKNNGAYLKLRMDYSMVRSFLQVTERNKPLFYRFCDANGNPVDTDYPEDETHQQFTDASGHKYGCVWVHQEESKDAAFMDRDVYGYQYFVIANRFFRLDPSKTYYVSVSLPSETQQADGTYSYTPAEWGNLGKPCSIYSKIISIRQQEFVVTSGNGQAVSKFFAECGQTQAAIKLKAKLSIPNAVYGGRKEIDWKFDWFISNEEGYQKALADDLFGALARYRAKYGSSNYFGDVNYLDLPFREDANGEFCVEDRSVMSTYISSSSEIHEDTTRLYLEYADSLVATAIIPDRGDVHTNIYFIPVSGTYTDPETGATYEICPDPLVNKLVLSHTTPQLYLGFKSVTYPDAWDESAKYVRLGLKQLNELKQGTILRIPINHYRDAYLNEGSDRNNLAMEEDNGANLALPRCVRLVSTNDPTVDAGKIARFATTGGANRYLGGKVGEVIADNHYITPQTETIGIDFSKNVENYDDGTSVTNDITFHEGYDYEFVLSYHDATKKIGNADTATAICYAYTYFTLRVIPEYVTWTGAQPTNTNWNNDLNWRRADKKELFKDRDGQNSDNYQDYGTDVAGVQQYPNSAQPDSTPQAFVPMKFTKVVINPGTSAPYLGNYSVDERMGIIDNLYNPNLSDGTENIAYDLMVKMDREADGLSYGCERFYANTCKEVFFRTNKTDLPSGEGQIRNQHYLAYQKAWVDYAMSPNRWNLLAAPLHSVYAGDFYVPHATGRQETEAFQPITFDTSKGYSRTRYPIYQRNWNNTESRVVTADGSSYDASVPYEETTDTLIFSQWSHAYNDVTVPYLPGRAFSVWPRTLDAAQDDTCAVVRLPKADDAYNYYDYQGNLSQVEKESVDRTLAGYLVTTKTAADDPQQLTGFFSVTLDAGTQVRNGYFLLGNPYMATLDMSQFFKDNPGLYRKYWLFEDGNLKAYGGEADENSNIGMVGPMRGFFVKSRAGSNVQTVNFQASQCTTVFYATGQTASTDQTVQLDVRDHAGHASSATVTASPKCKNSFVEDEDVETLFDSNIGENVPQLYTMAGQKAATINRMTDLQNVPLGVQAPTDEEVTLTVSGAETLSQPLYLFDAKKKTTVRLTADASVTLKANETGRYFLTSQAVAPQPIQTALRCYSMTAGTIVAATSANDVLTEIAVYDTKGRTVALYHPDTAVYTFRQSPGIYLVTLNSRDVPEGRTFKILVK